MRYNIHALFGNYTSKVTFANQYSNIMVCPKPRSSKLDLPKPRLSTNFPNTP